MPDMRLVYSFRVDGRSLHQHLCEVHLKDNGHNLRDGNI